MQVIDSETLSRRKIIKFYIEYDAKKKKILLPTDIDEWDWSDPNAIDEKLKSNSFKHGVIAGFKQWKLMRLSRRDLLQCAIVNGIKEFKNIPYQDQQVLSKLVRYKEFEDWKPDRQTNWYESIEAGEPFPPNWAMILRPTVPSEAPAKWYIEDGSGRAICFLRRLRRQEDDKSLAYGYLGADPDPRSEFMKKYPFSELVLLQFIVLEYNEFMAEEPSKENPLFEARTPLGFSVRTTNSYWNIIITMKHPMMNGKENDVQNALEHPDEIRQSQKDPTVFLF